MQITIPLTFIAIFIVTPVWSQDYTVCEEAIRKVAGNEWNGNRIKKDIDDAIALCTAPANAGNVNAQYDLSMLHIVKNGNKENQQSLLWTKKAANNNFTEAQCHLGDMYLIGNVVAKSIELAIHWYEKAAQSGNVLAMRELGAIYLSAKKEIDKSIFWYSKAADKCDKLSISKLLEIYSKNIDGNKKDSQKVKFWDDKYTDCNRTKLMKK